MASKPKERILVVEADAYSRDLIARQALGSLGYLVSTADSASAAIQKVFGMPPDVIVASQKLPDLSGKDLLVALTAQGLTTPFIIIADEGMEADVIQSFRLGATDFLFKPLREAEVVAAVERALSNVRAQRERDQLARRLEETNRDLKRKVQELTTISALGKAVTSVVSQQSLFQTIVDGAVEISQADRGYLLTREERKRRFLMRAALNLPKDLPAELNKPFEDQVSSLVALSGEALLLHGPAVERFTLRSLGRSFMVVPVKAQEEVIGLLVVIRKEEKPFTAEDRLLLQAVADFVAISLINARLFQALEERARKLQSALQEGKRFQAAR